MLFKYVSKSLQKLILAFILATLLFALNTLQLEALTALDLQHLDNDDQGGYGLSVWGHGNFVYLSNTNKTLDIYIL